MKKTAIILLAVFCLAGCVTPQVPRSFSKVTKPTWASIEIRDDVDFDRAWKTTLGILVRDFDIEFLSKEDGYIRTAWTYTWSGAYQENYRVRVTVKFSDDRKTINVKSEAQAKFENFWIIGVDSRQLSTLKTDLMGTIGRTTR